MVFFSEAHRTSEVLSRTEPDPDRTEPPSGPVLDPLSGWHHVWRGHSHRNRFGRKKTDPGSGRLTGVFLGLISGSDQSLFRRRGMSDA